MIHKITLENFFSLADRQELGFRVPDNAPDMPCFRPSQALPDIRLPAVIGFFGSNASGKSTMLRALTATIGWIVYSFSTHVSAPIPWFEAYMRKDWLDKPSVVAIEFDGRMDAGQPASLFRYELRISPAKTLAYEGLFHAPKGRFRKLFERKEQDFSFGEAFGITDNDPRIQSIRPNASIISTLAQFNHPLSSYFKKALESVQANVVGFEKLNSNPQQLLSFYRQNHSYLDGLNRELRKLDVGLEAMRIGQGPGGLFAQFDHTGLDQPIPMFGESQGTRKFIELFVMLQSVLNQGSLAIMDELDTDLHPLLIPEIFRWFGDPIRNPHGAQLFFTAHNPALLDVMEKEQVFFTEKSAGKPSIVYGARDIQGLRREPSLMKKYLGGELGAVPHIG